MFQALMRQLNMRRRRKTPEKGDGREHSSRLLPFSMVHEDSSHNSHEDSLHGECVLASRPYKFKDFSLHGKERNTGPNGKTVEPSKPSQPVVCQHPASKNWTRNHSVPKEEPSAKEGSTQIFNETDATAAPKAIKTVNPTLAPERGRRGGLSWFSRLAWFGLHEVFLSPFTFCMFRFAWSPKA